jgi:hypothetical protein
MRKHGLLICTICNRVLSTVVYDQQKKSVKSWWFIETDETPKRTHQHFNHDTDYHKVKHAHENYKIYNMTDQRLIEYKGTISHF